MHSLPAVIFLAIAGSVGVSAHGADAPSVSRHLPPVFSRHAIDAEWACYEGPPDTASLIAAESSALPSFEMQSAETTAVLGCTAGACDGQPACKYFDVSDLGFCGKGRMFCRAVWSDYCEFYSCDSVPVMAIGFSAAAIMANTDIDESFREAYQTGIRDPSARNQIDNFKVLGEGEYLIAASAAAMFVGALGDDFAVGEVTREWGSRNLRTLLVGAPPLYCLQWATGGSRPGETSDESSWKPFQDSNGVSGHAFVGAVPFLSAAKMSDGILAKSVFYAGSTLCGWSRINSDAHYLSQVVAGWCVAYVSASAVDRSQTHRSWAIVPWTPPEGGSGLGWEYRR